MMMLSFWSVDKLGGSMSLGQKTLARPAFRRHILWLIAYAYVDKGAMALSIMTLGVMVLFQTA